MNKKVIEFLEHHNPDSPCLVVDIDLVIKQYEDLRRCLPSVEIIYAINTITNL